MKFLRKIFSSQQMGNHPDEPQGEEAAVEAADTGPPQVQGVLILTRRHLNDSWGLLDQITALQRSKGYRIAINMISKAAATDRFDDEAYLHEKIRKEFAKLGGDDLIQRTKVFPCQASGGNSGVYCIIFDRPQP